LFPDAGIRRLRLARRQMRAFRKPNADAQLLTRGEGCLRFPLFQPASVGPMLQRPNEVTRNRQLVRICTRCSMSFRISSLLCGFLLCMAVEAVSLAYHPRPPCVLAQRIDGRHGAAYPSLRDHAASGRRAGHREPRAGAAGRHLRPVSGVGAGVSAGGCGVKGVAGSRCAD